MGRPPARTEAAGCVCAPVCKCAMPRRGGGRQGRLSDPGALAVWAASAERPAGRRGVWEAGPQQPVRPLAGVRTSVYVTGVYVTGADARSLSRGFRSEESFPCGKGSGFRGRRLAFWEAGGPAGVPARVSRVDGGGGRSLVEGGRARALCFSTVLGFWVPGQVSAELGLGDPEGEGASSPAFPNDFACQSGSGVSRREVNERAASCRPGARWSPGRLTPGFLRPAGAARASEWGRLAGSSFLMSCGVLSTHVLSSCAGVLADAELGTWCVNVRCRGL